MFVTPKSLTILLKLFVCVTAAGSFTVRPRGFPLFPWGPELRVRARGLQDLTSCQQNPILFGWAGLTTPTRLGFLFRLTFSVTSRRNGNYDSITKCKGRRYGSDDSSQCHLYRASNAINSITTQKQLYLTRKTVGTSRTVPGRAHGWPNMADSSNWRSVAKEQHPDPDGTFYRGS